MVRVLVNHLWQRGSFFWWWWIRIISSNCFLFYIPSPVGHAHREWTMFCFSKDLDSGARGGRWRWRWKRKKKRRGHFSKHKYGFRMWKDEIWGAKFWSLLRCMRGCAKRARSNTRTHTHTHTWRQGATRMHGNTEGLFARLNWEGIEW